MQAQLDAQKKHCIFCKIVKGDMSSKKVYEDDLLLAVLDVNPCAKGHVLVLPKEHYPIMPHIPPKTFKRLFGILPELGKALKTSLVSTGFNVFIANGGAAGQQAQHFLFHLFPRENGDQMWKYHFNTHKMEENEETTKFNKMIQNNLPIMMNNHFGRAPGKWHTQGSKGETPAFLAQLPHKGVVYEDEKALVTFPEKSLCKGHLVVHSKNEQKTFEKLDEESASHLFYVASYCSTAVFEGLGAHGSNIILKTGESQDNEDGKLHIHILPRFSEDKVDVTPAPLKPKPDLNPIQERIKEETFLIEHKRKKKKEEKKPLFEDPSGFFTEEVEEVMPEPENTELKEISAAIEFVKE